MGINRSIKPVGSSLHPQEDFTCPPGGRYVDYLSPLEPLGATWGNYVEETKQHDFTAQSRRPRKETHVAVWGDTK